MSQYEFDSVRIEKERAITQYNRLHRLSSIVKTLEFCLALALLSWSLSRWSSFSTSSVISTGASYVCEAVSFCGEFVRRIALVLLSQHFVFLIGNAIILTLLLHSSSHSSSSSTTSSDVVDRDESSGSKEYEPEITPATKTSVTDQISAATEAPATEVAHDSTPLVEYEEKEIVDKYAVSKRRLLFGKRRTRSAEFNLKEEQLESGEKVVEYHRSESELCRKTESLDGDESTSDSREPDPDEVEDLSGEEFQRRVEAFIARQQRFLREESLSATAVTGI